MAAKKKLYRTKVKIGIKPDGSPLNKWISAHTKRELEDLKRRTIEYYILGTASSSAPVQFGPYAISWYETYKKPHLAPSSQGAYKTALNRHILPAFGDRNLRAFNSTELQRFMNSFENANQAIITTVCACLRGIFKHACIDRIITVDPAQYLIKPAAKPAKDRAILSPMDRKTIVNTLDAHPEYALMAVLYYTGLRSGEARGLMWSDVDWKNRLIHVQRDMDDRTGTTGKLKTKNSDRMVPISDPLYRILRPLRGLPNTFMFTGVLSSKPVTHGEFSKNWIRFMRECGFTTPIPEAEQKYSYRHDADPRKLFAAKFTPHCFRHNFITICYENGLDPYATMRLVGHSNIQTTMNVYTHLADDKLADISQRVNDMFGSR